MSDTKTVRSANTREAIGIRKAIYLPILWAALVAMPFWIVPLGGYTALASQVLVIGLAAMGVNFIVGHTGVISFGHSAYFGLGAYGVGMTMRYLVPSTPIGLLAGVLVGTVGGAIVGYLIIRLRGIYFALATIAFSQVFYFIAFRWNSATGGDNGLTGFRRMNIHLGFAQIPVRSDLAYYYVVLVVFAVCTGVMAIILRSPFGRTLLAIRENERRARFLGIPINLHIWLAFTISCFFTAVAGGLYALLNNFTNPSNLSWELAGDFVLMAVIGGMRSFWGPLLGAAIFVVAQDYLSGITQDWMFFIGMIFVLAVLFLPRGVMGLFRK